MVAYEQVENAEILPDDAAALLKYWRQCEVAGTGPTRAEFGPLELRRWLGKIDIYEVDGEGAEFRLRLSGTETVAMTGEDWTGKTARDVDRAYGHGFHDDLLIVYRSRRPALHRIKVFQKDFMTVYRLLLPIFAGPEDRRVRQIFLAMFVADRV